MPVRIHSSICPHEPTPVYLCISLSTCPGTISIVIWKQIKSVSCPYSIPENQKSSDDMFLSNPLPFCSWLWNFATFQLALEPAYYSHGGGMDYIPKNQMEALHNFAVWRFANLGRILLHAHFLHSVGRIRSCAMVSVDTLYYLCLLTFWIDLMIGMQTQLKLILMDHIAVIDNKVCCTVSPGPVQCCFFSRNIG